MTTLEEAYPLIDAAVESAVNLLSQGQIADAELVLDQILKVNPNETRAISLMGLANYQQRKYAEAIPYFVRALEDAEDADTHNNLALCYACLRCKDYAIQHMEEALRLNPNQPHYYANLAAAYAANDMYEEAVVNYEKSLQIKQDPITLRRLGYVHGNYQQIYMAMDCFKVAVLLQPDDPQAHLDLAYAYFLSNNLKEAWREYEWRLDYLPQMQNYLKQYGADKLLKLGDPLEGKKVVVYSEQGLGDFIQFLRYIPRLREQECAIFLQTSPEIIPLLEENNLGQSMVTNGWAGSFDYHCSILSLPYLLGMEEIPPAPYLSCHLVHDFKHYQDTFNVGIVWAGNPNHPNDSSRSCPLKYFRPLTEIPGVRLFSLQKDLRPRAYSHDATPVDLTEGCEEMRVVNLSPHLSTFQDTAAAINGLDLVISVDTSVAHLAGAIGKEVWTLLPYMPDWRWLATGEHTHWYDSMRLIRQPKAGDWEGVFVKAREFLTQKLSEKSKRGA